MLQNTASHNRCAQFSLLWCLTLYLLCHGTSLFASKWPTHPVDHANQLPVLGAPPENQLSAAQAHKIGQRILHQLRQQGKLISSPTITDYTQKLGQALVAHSPSPDQRMTFFVVNNPSINAFALPGGFIGIHTGLFRLSDSEGELAAVIAHEIAHVQQHHIERLLAHDHQLLWPTLLGLVGTVLLAPHDPKLAQGALTATLASRQQATLRFTRKHEQEADVVGLTLLKRAGYDPHCMTSLLRKMQRAQHYSALAIPEFLRSHPLSNTRIAEAQARISAQPSQKPKTTKAAFHWIKAQLQQTQFANPSDALRFFAKQKNRSPYGYALALYHNQHYQAAERRLLALLKAYPDAIPVLITQAKLEAATGRHTQALRRLANHLKKNPSNYPLTAAYASLLITQKSYAKAILVLRQSLRRYPVHATLYRLLGRAQLHAGQRSKAHESFAEAYWLDGEYKTALHQLHIALHMKPLSDYMRARLQAKQRLWQRNTRNS